MRCRFRLFEFHAVGKIDPDAMGHPIDRAQDRSTRCFQDAGNARPCSPCIDIDFEDDPLEKRVVNGFRHRMEDPPMRCGLLCFSPVKYSGERMPLLGVGPLIDDSLLSPLPS